jgi:DNA-binding MarR family transcriptional regulator
MPAADDRLQLPSREERERSALFLLADASRLVRRDFDRRARKIGLTRAQWQVLLNVFFEEGIRQGVLADRLEIEPITLVRLVDRLEKSGLVERRSDPSDRRVRTLHLTPDALPLLKRIRALALETREVALAGIPARERVMLVELLARIRGNLCEKAEHPSASVVRMSKKRAAIKRSDVRRRKRA